MYFNQYLEYLKEEKDKMKQFLTTTLDINYVILVIGAILDIEEHYLQIKEVNRDIRTRQVFDFTKQEMEKVNIIKITNNTIEPASELALTIMLTLYAELYPHRFTNNMLSTILLNYNTLNPRRCNLKQLLIEINDGAYDKFLYTLDAPHYLFLNTSTHALKLIENKFIDLKLHLLKQELRVTSLIREPQLGLNPIKGFYYDPQSNGRFCGIIMYEANALYACAEDYVARANYNGQLDRLKVLYNDQLYQYPEQEICNLKVDQNASEIIPIYSTRGESTTDYLNVNYYYLDAPLENIRKRLI